MLFLKRSWVFQVFPFSLWGSVSRPIELKYVIAPLYIYELMHPCLNTEPFLNEPRHWASKTPPPHPRVRQVVLRGARRKQSRFFRWAGELYKKPL